MKSYISRKLPTATRTTVFTFSDRWELVIAALLIGASNGYVLPSDSLHFITNVLRHQTVSGLLCLGHAPTVTCAAAVKLTNHAQLCD